MAKTMARKFVTMADNTQAEQQAAGNGRILVALAGNPNSGKTTVFNNLTGARQHVGNYPGVTVEKKEGRFRHEGREIQVIDLPGTYSLTAYTPEEVIARNVVIDESPDVLVDIVDASNLERNLYLATQFMELGVPLVFAFNMSDVAKARGHAIDTVRLSKLLNVKIVCTVGHKNLGMDELKDAIVEVGECTRVCEPVPVTYGNDIERELGRIVPLIEQQGDVFGSCRPRWIAVKLLENDELVVEDVKNRAVDPNPVLSTVEASRQHLRGEFGDDAEILIADRRYGFISGACQETVRTTVESRHSVSDRIDARFV